MRLEQALHKGRYPKGQRGHEEVLNIINHQRNGRVQSQ